MAQLHKTTYELPPIDYKNLGQFDETEHHKAFQELCDNNEMFSIGVADGFAWYIVRSRKPLILQHVDYCDGYRAPGALIRGLRVSDIDAYARRSKLGFKF